jgi:hypothetical protein
LCCLNVNFKNYLKLKLIHVLFDQSWARAFFKLRTCAFAHLGEALCACAFALLEEALRACTFSLFFWPYISRFCVRAFALPRSLIFCAHNFVLVRPYTARTARTINPEQDRHNWNGRTGQPEQDSQNRTARTGQT